MKKSIRMKQFITAMEKKHGVNFSIPGTYLKLDGRDAFMDLSIESPRKGQITITHYYEQNGDLIADPDVEILVGCDGEFYPYAITHAPPFGYMVYAEIDFDKGTFTRFKPRGQADLSSFVNTWATNLGRQGFREAEAKVKVQG